MERDEALASLFGDGDEVDSLFGDGDGDGDGGDASSSFMEGLSPVSVDAPAPPPAPALPSLLLPSAFSPPSPRGRALPSPPLSCEGAQDAWDQDVSTESLLGSGDLRLPPGMDLELELELLLDEAEPTPSAASSQERHIDHPPQAGHTSSDGAQSWRSGSGVEPSAAGSRAASCQLPPLPPRVDQGCPNLDEFIPHISLDSGSRKDKAFRQLELSDAEGDDLLRETKLYLADPANAIELLSVSHVDYLRKNKLKTMASALSLLVLRGWGERWFSRASSHSRQRTLCWPDDSTRIFVGFVQIVYRVARNQRQRKYPKRRAPKDGPDAPRQRQAAQPPQPAHLRTVPPSLLPYASPRFLPTGGRLGQGVPPTPAPAPASSGGPTACSKKRKRSDTAAEPFTKVAPNADLTYMINVMRGAHRAVPPIKLIHRYQPDLCRYSAVVAHCAGFDAPFTVQINTPEGFGPVEDDEAWDRAVRAVYDEEVMDGVVRVKVDIHEPITIE